MWSLTIVIHAAPLVPCCVKYLLQLQFDAASDFFFIPPFNDLYSEIQKYSCEYTIQAISIWTTVCVTCWSMLKDTEPQIASEASIGVRDY